METELVRAWKWNHWNVQCQFPHIHLFIPSSNIRLSELSCYHWPSIAWSRHPSIHPTPISSSIYLSIHLRLSNIQLNALLFPFLTKLKSIHSSLHSFGFWTYINLFILSIHPCTIFSRTTDHWTSIHCFSSIHGKKKKRRTDRGAGFLCLTETVRNKSPSSI